MDEGFVDAMYSRSKAAYNGDAPSKRARNMTIEECVFIYNYMEYAIYGNSSKWVRL